MSILNQQNQQHMKTTKRILCLLLLMALNQLAYSQKSRTKVDSTERENTSSSNAPDEEKCPPCRTQQEIIWDFQTGKITEPRCLQKGTNVPIKIRGINRTLYNVVIDDKFKTFDLELPGVLDFEKKQQEAQQNIAASNSVASVMKLDKNGDQKKATDALAQFLLNSKKVIDCGACLQAILQKDIGYDKAQEQLNICTGGKSEDSLRVHLKRLYKNIEEVQTSIMLNSDDPFLIQQLNTALNSTDISKAIEDIMTLYTKITSQKTFEYTTTLPIKEAYELDLELKAISKPNTKVTSSSVNLTYAIKGIKISISPGLFVNYFPGARTCYKEDFELNGMPTDSVVIRSTFDDNSLLPSIGALIHVSFFGCKDHDFALSAGVSTHFTTGDMRWHIGTSWLIGKQRRFVLSAGLSIGQNIQEIDQQYQLDTPYPKAALEGKAITQEVAHVGGYLGVFYNIPAPPKS